jgi:hypothetical protein
MAGGPTEGQGGAGAGSPGGGGGAVAVGARGGAANAAAATAAFLASRRLVDVPLQDGQVLLLRNKVRRAVRERAAARVAWLGQP